MKLNKAIFLTVLLCASQAGAMSFDSVKNWCNSLSTTKKIMAATAITLPMYAFYKYIQAKISNYNYLVSNYKGIDQKLKELGVTKKEINEGEMFIEYGDVAIKLKNKKQHILIILEWDGILVKHIHKIYIIDGYEIQFPKFKFC